MTLESLKNNLDQIKEITRELYVFTNQLNIIKNLEISSKVVINVKEKRLLINSITALTNQLNILNNSIPGLLEKIGFYKKFEGDKGALTNSPIQQERFIQVKYRPNPEKEKVSLTIDNADKSNFIKNLSVGSLSINKLKSKFSVEKPAVVFGKANKYAKLSNHFFRDLSNKLLAKGHFKPLNKNLRKMNSPFIIGTYVSMMFFTIFISFFASILLSLFLLFFNVGLAFPFFSIVETSLLIRFVQVFWIIFAIPLTIGLFMYLYPGSEAKNLGKKIDQELPFVAIHVSAIATSGVEPLSIFKIILQSKEYKYTNMEFKKLMNLINFHGKDLVTALKKIARASSSQKLRGLLDGLSTTITSGGNLHSFLDKHAESLLFDYRLEREKYTKVSETFMDIYISIVIAAPMIMLMLFVIMASTGALTNFLGLSVQMLGFLIILAIIVLNIGFLVFLQMKQPVL
jgi:Flp pilus assembly protein TadB